MCKFYITLNKNFGNLLSTKLHGFSTYKAFKLFPTGKTEKNRNSSKIGHPTLDLMAGLIFNLNYI